MRQPKIRYVLEPKSKKISERTNPEKVTAVISFGYAESIGERTKYKPFKISTEASVLPSDFGDAKTNFKYDKDLLNSNKRNQGLKTIINLINNSVDKLYSNYNIIGANPRPSEFKNELLINLNRQKRQNVTKHSILEFLNKKIVYFEGLIEGSQKDKIKENSIKPYRTLARYIVEYQTIRSVVLTFEDFNISTYNDLWIVQDDILRGLIPCPKIEGYKKRTISKYGFLSNSILKYQKTLVRLHILAKKAKIKINLDIDDENLLLEETESSKELYIDELNIKKIINYVPQSEEMEMARNYTVLACFLGMRYESMMELSKSEIQLSKCGQFYFVHSKQNKTNTECFVPILKPVMEIYKKNEDSFPSFSDNATMNLLIKRLFTEAGIVTKLSITLHTFRCGTKTIPKTANNVITTHDFRSSFKSNLADKISDEVIENILHPAKKRKTSAKVYDRRDIEAKAKAFYLELTEKNKLELYKSDVYTF